jgi:hypothetical protein
MQEHGLDHNYKASMGVASRVPRFGGLAGEVIESVGSGLALAGGPYLLERYRLGRAVTAYRGLE